MASRTTLIDISYHDDDDTGMYEIGEIDFGIHGTLDKYLQNYGYKGKNDLINKMSYLMYEIERRFREMNPPMGGQVSSLSPNDK